MSPTLFTQSYQSLFRIASPSIGSILIQITVASTLNNPSSIQHSITQAGKNSLVGGGSFKKEVETALYTIQSVRWRIRKFVLRWLYKRLVSCSTDDIFTLEPIQDPVYIVVWKSRHIYSFEIKTLHRAITQSLSHSSGMFPIPLRPKNPLTNLILSLGQLISIWNTFAYGSFPLSSVVTQYRTVQYDHQRFMEEYSTVLSISSMKRCIMNPFDVEGGECLLDFIETTYEYNGIVLKPYFRDRIHYAIFKHKDNVFIRKFRIKYVDYNYILLVKKNYSASEILQELSSVYRACIPIIQDHSCVLKGNLH
jgi:hypothetical protein